jgi:hypothetical protein
VPIDELGQPLGDAWTLEAYGVTGHAQSWLVTAAAHGPGCFAYPEGSLEPCRVEARTFRADGHALTPWVDVGPYDDRYIVEYTAAISGDRFLVAYPWEGQARVGVLTIDGERVGESTIAFEDVIDLRAYGVPQGFVLADAIDARLVLVDRAGSPVSEPLPLVTFADWAIPVIGDAAGAWAAAWAEHRDEVGRPASTHGVFIREFGCAWP